MRELDAKKLQKTMTRKVKKDIESHRIACAAVTVLQHGETVLSICEGEKNHDTGEKLMPRDIFRLASMTKPVTAVAALIGVQNGLFDLNDKISDYFPRFLDKYIGKLENGHSVAVRKSEKEMRLFHLLSHSNGLLCEDDVGNDQMKYIPEYAYESNTMMAESASSNVLLSYEPGEGSAYSAFAGFDVIAGLIEKKSGMTYGDFLKKYLFDPLGLKDMTFIPSEEQWSRMVSVHDVSAYKNDFITVNLGRHTFEKFPLHFTSAGASLVGTLEDYTVFAEMLRGKGEYKGVRILEKDVAELMTKCYVPKGTPGRDDYTGWGLGVRLIEDGQVLPAGSFGWSGAYGTHFWVDPENDITAVYLKSMRWYDCGEGTAFEFEKTVMSSLTD